MNNAVMASLCNIKRRPTLHSTNSKPNFAINLTISYIVLIVTRFCNKFNNLIEYERKNLNLMSYGY